METDRPLWRSRTWLTATAGLLGLTAVLATVAPGGERGFILVWGITLVSVLCIVVFTAIRVRAERANFERELAEWATERASQAERLRIAGELHDLVSHGIGLITVRAAAARTVAGDAAVVEHATALADIEKASRETTAELRRMLTVLRQPGAAPLRPADTFADLPAIVATAESAGLTVAFEAAESGIDPDSTPAAGAVGGELSEVSPGVQLTACAVVREALNNAVRHAGPTAARVGIRREGGAVIVRVADDGPRGEWRAEPGAGRGLEMLRERIASHGGSLEAGRHGHGFRVCAHIPVGHADA